MADQKSENVIVVASTAMVPNQKATLISLFNSDGSAFVPLTTANVMPNQATFNGADVAGINTQLNALRTKLINAGLMAAS